MSDLTTMSRVLKEQSEGKFWEPSVVTDRALGVRNAACEIEVREYIDNPAIPDINKVAHVGKILNSDGTMTKIMKATKIAFIEKLLWLDGKPFNFNGREYLHPIYNVDHHNLLLKTGRQVEKTTLLCNNMMVKSLIVPFHKSLYVSPSHSQTRQFSNDKLKNAIERSPLVKKYYQDHSVSAQVFEKGFTNGAMIFLRSCFRSADRTRGLALPDLYLDEIQDLLISEIPVIAEVTSHYPDSRHVYAGTPKSFQNPIETYWRDSTQNEWLVKCEACNKWNFLDELNIAPTEMYTSGQLLPGPVCKKCMKPINVRKGKWMTLEEGKRFTGFRIPQLMVPWIVGTREQWGKLLWKRDFYPTSQFANEVLGLSYDSASNPITKDEIIECCDPTQRMWTWPPRPEDIRTAKGMALTAGMDWGEGKDGMEIGMAGKPSVASYSILTIGGYDAYGKYTVRFKKKYTGRETAPDYVVKDVCQILGAYGVQTIGCDAGHGWGVNNQMIENLGSDRVIIFRYLGSLKERIKWDRKGWQFLLNRNMWMADLFLDLKKARIGLPCWKDYSQYARDILAIYTEYNEQSRTMRFDHKPTDPDDGFHSLLYSKLASDIMTGHVVITSSGSS